jgi:transmembrane sensor
MSLPAKPNSMSSLGTTQDQAIAWFARLQDSKASQSDRTDVNEWLTASPSHQAAYDKVTQLWQSQAFNAALSHYGTIPFPKKQQKLIPQRWVAAACVVFTSGWLLFTSGLTDRWQADAYTVTGEQRRLVLADGSAVTLNTDTALVFKTNSEQRGVRILSGEAYFEVQPDKTKPFIVATEQGSVTVVGTRFSVKVGAATEVDVESGLVVCAGEQGNNRQLSAGQHTRVTQQNVALATPIEPSQTFAWLKGRLVFHDQPLSEVITELGRYHSGAIVITDAKLAQTRITGNYKLDDTSAILRALVDITGARVINLSPYLTILKS